MTSCAAGSWIMRGSWRSRAARATVFSAAWMNARGVHVPWQCGRTPPQWASRPAPTPATAVRVPKQDRGESRRRRQPLAGGHHRPGTHARAAAGDRDVPGSLADRDRSEEHTSELQSQSNLVCRLLLEKKKKKQLTLI